jgi:hypothetical protein
MEVEMKLCKDCKWYVGVGIEYSEQLHLPIRVSEEHCSSPKTSYKKDDVVRGEVEKFAFKCGQELRTLRSLVNACGPTAKWFEEKEKPIPKCRYCKYLETGYLMCLATHSFLVSIDHCRLNESLCGKYGNWWEKKEELRPGAIIQVSKPCPPPKKQSWLCRIICGR